jgi:glycosyltransferase 2 family protein
LEEAKPEMNKPGARGSMWQRLLMAALILASLGFIAVQVHRGWPELAHRTWSVSWPAAALSFAALFINFILVAWVWAVVFRALEKGKAVPIRHTFGILYAAQLGRYIPGKIWLVFGQIAIARSMGYSSATALTAGVVQNLCGLCAAALILAVSSLGSGKSLWIAAAGAGTAVAIFAGLVFAPARVEAWVNRIQLRRNRGPVRITLDHITIAKTTGLMILAWFVHCAAFVFLIASITPVSAKAAFQLAMDYNLAYHFSLLFIIVPGGIGVREGTLTALMTGVLGSAAAALVSILQRFWYLAGEIVSFLIALVLTRGFVSLDSFRKRT